MHPSLLRQVWDDKAALPTGYGAALLAQWATSQARNASRETASR